LTLSGWNGVCGGHFSKEIRARLSPEQIAEAFSLDRQLRHVDAIFERVFTR
jgi:hypothetical protein